MSSLPLKTLIMATTVFTFTACTPNSDPVPQKETVQNQHHAHHSPQTTDKQQQTPNHKTAYTEAMHKMHQAMMAANAEKDPDIAFAKGMIPHHQGAVDMANIELKYGKDEQMRKLAQDIINAQQTEIDFMNQWLAKKNPSPQQTQSQSKSQP